MQSNGTLYIEHRRKDSISGFWSQIWPEDLLLTCSIISEEIPFPNLCNGVIRTQLTDYLGKAGSVYKKPYPSEPLLLLGMCRIPLVCLGWEKISVVQTSPRPAASTLQALRTGKYFKGHLSKPLHAALFIPAPITYTCHIPSEL